MGPLVVLALVVHSMLGIALVVLCKLGVVVVLKQLEQVALVVELQSMGHRHRMHYHRHLEVFLLHRSSMSHRRSIFD